MKKVDGTILLLAINYSHKKANCNLQKMDLVSIPGKTDAVKRRSQFFRICNREDFDGEEFAESRSQNRLGRFLGHFSTPWSAENGQECLRIGVWRGFFKV